MTLRQRLLAVIGVLVALALLLPFVWWQFLGPERLEGLDLGVAPDTVDVVGQDGDPDARRLALLAGREDLADDAEGIAAQTYELPPLNISSSTRVTLLFSVGSDGMTRSDANRLRVADVGDRGGDRLTDSMMLLVSDAPTRKAALVSVPRDLWLSHRGHRINETYVRRGVQAFVDDVSGVVGLPIHHVVQVNFTAFADLVDAVDGVALDVPMPMADLYSTLYVPQAGCWRFDGADALAYARSRNTLTTTDGRRWRAAKASNDFTRIARQQAMVSAAWDQVRGPGFVRRIPDLISIANGLTIDAGLGPGDVVDLARAFSDVAAGRVERHILPVVDRRVGAAYVLGISWRRAIPFYERLRNWPPGGPIDTGSSGSAGTSGESGTSGDSGAPGESGADDPQGTGEPAPSPSPTPSEESGSSGGGLDPLEELTGNDEEPSEEPSAEPQQDPSPEPDPTTSQEPPTESATRPDNPSPGSRSPSAPGGCSRASAWELPDNPLDYLAAIADGDEVPPYTPSGRGDGGPDEDPDGDVGGDDPDPADDGGDEGGADEAEPTDEPSSGEPGSESSEGDADEAESPEESDPQPGGGSGGSEEAEGSGSGDVVEPTESGPGGEEPAA